MSNTPPAYGLWTLVVINSAIFLIFAFSFTKPKTARDWRSFGAFSARGAFSGFASATAGAGAPAASFSTPAASA